jgi:hypothetical protein
VGAEVHLQFKGQLLLPNEPGPGLRVNLDVADHHLAMESETGGLGAWPLEVVEVRRLQGDLFAMTVAGEDLHFVAEDTVSFTYTGLPAIKRVSPNAARSTLRSLLTRFWSDTPKRGLTTLPPAEPVLEEESPVLDTPPVFDIPSFVEAGGLSDFDGDLDETVPNVLDEIPLVVPPESIPTIDLGSLREDDPRPESPFQIPVIEPDPASWPELVDLAPADELFDASGPPRHHIEPVQESESEFEAGVCPAVRGDGQPCRSPILTSSGYCYPHDPDQAPDFGYDAAQKARANLKNKGTARLNRVYGRLDKAMRQVERGELEPEIAMAMAQLARTMCAILELRDEEQSTETEPGN